jgi:hypothetical protein
VGLARAGADYRANPAGIKWGREKSLSVGFGVSVTLTKFGPPNLVNVTEIIQDLAGLSLVNVTETGKAVGPGWASTAVLEV